MRQRMLTAAALILATAIMVIAAGVVSGMAADAGPTPTGPATNPTTRPTTRPQERVEPPPPRTRAEVEALLGNDFAKAGGEKGPRPLRVLLVAGKKDHGTGEHDYPAWLKRWEPLLARAPGVRVTTAFGRPDRAAWDGADLAVFYCWGPQFWDAESYPLLDAFLARGGGLVVLHSAVIGDADPQALADRIGFAWTSKGTKYRHGPHDLTFAKPDHPIVRGYTKLHVVDEDYWPILFKAGDGRDGAAGGPDVLATTPDDGGVWPMVWTYVPPAGGDKGRVFCTTLCHYTWTLDDPLARALVLRGMAWAAGEPADRFLPLALDGVTLRDELR